MPYIANSPESILPRSDSRNPATTCKGITNNGRPCRRQLASSVRSSSSKRDISCLGEADSYCWQHKDQAHETPRKTWGTREQEVLQHSRRSSIDTFIERLGGLDINEEEEEQGIHPRLKKSDQNKGNRSDASGTQGIQEKRHEILGQKPPPRQTGFCCFYIVDDDNPPAPRPIRRQAGNPNSTGPRVSHPPAVVNRRRVSTERVKPLTSGQITPRTPNSTIPNRSHPATPSKSSRRSLSSYDTPTRPSLRGTPASSSSQTQSLLALIPPHLSPQTTSLLLAELAKPVSQADTKGYIYIAWATPSISASTAPPPPEVASLLLPSPEWQHQGRRMSDAIRVAQNHYAVTPSSGANPGTIRLKIGRANNVHRRLNEWTRQCSHHLTLIRHYPYSPSPLPSRASTPGDDGSSIEARQVPHVNRVERLIHIELSDKRVKDQGQCKECGKEHREWFEFDTTKDELRLVDECVRRWVRWSERQV